jgi:hypothetical protein
VIWLLLVLALSLPRLSLAQDLSANTLPFRLPGVLFTHAPLMRQHPLLYGLAGWWRVLPGLDGGRQAYDLAGLRHATLTSMGVGLGTQPSTRPGATGEWRLDGTASYLTLGDLADFDYANATFTVMTWFRSTDTTTRYLIARRIGDGAHGGWFIRVNGAAGTITARICDSGDLAAGERTTVSTTTTNGLWQHVAVVFQTDTVTRANNDMTIYLNGLVDQGSRSDSGAGAYAVCSGGSCPVNFGASSVPDFFLTGALDHIMIFGRGLNSHAITGLLRESMQGDPTLLRWAQPWVPSPLNTGSFQLFFAQ